MDLPGSPEHCNNLTVALAWAARGAAVFPCYGKKPCFGVRWKSHSTRDLDEIESFWRRFPGAAPSIVTGKSGFLVFDCDREDLGGEGGVGINDGTNWLLGAWKAAVDRGEQTGRLEDVPGCKTPSGGRHYYFKRPVGIEIGRGRLPDKADKAKGCNIDIKTDHSYVLAPGADTTGQLDGGGHYEAIGDISNAPECPEWLLWWVRVEGQQGAPKTNGAHDGAQNGAQLTDFAPASPERITSYLQAALAGIATELCSVRRGEGLNDVIFKQACKLGELVAGSDGQLTEQEAITWMTGTIDAEHQLPADDKAYGSRGTIASGIARGAHNKARGPHDDPGSEKLSINLGGQQQQKTEAPSPLPLVSFKPYVCVDPTTIPLRPWVYGKLLLRGAVTLTVAPGGTGKSSLTIVETLAQVSGKPLLNVETRGRRLQVMLWGLEDPEDETARRIEAARMHYKLPVSDIDGFLFIPDERCARLITATVERGGIRIQRPLVDAICSEITARKIDVVVIDPFVSSHEVPENDNVMQDRVIKEWVEVAKRCKCAVHLVDHTRKLGPDAEVGVESARGAKSKTDAARVVRVINRMSGAEADGVGVKNPGLYFRTFSAKMNFAPPAERSDWFELKSVSLGNDPDAVIVDGERCAEDDNVGVVVNWKYPDALDGVTGAMVDKLIPIIRKGKYRANQNSKGGWVGEAVAQIMGLDAKKDKKRINRMVQSWLASGLFTVVEARDANRNKRQFIKVTADLTEDDIVAGAGGGFGESFREEGGGEPDDDIAR
jgi:hypothetical protein